MILQIARKDLKVILRDRSSLIFIFALPLVFMGVFGAAFGRSGENAKPMVVSVLVFNGDKGKHGKELIEAMRTVGLKPELDTQGSTTLTERMKKGEKPLGVIIPEDFSQKLDTAATNALDRTGKIVEARVQVLVDPAVPQVAGMAQGALSGATRSVAGTVFARQLEARFGTSPASGSQDIIALDIKKTNEGLGTKLKKPRSVGDTMIPGLAVYFVFFLANGVAATLITEREQGTLRRMLSAPVSRFQILAGKMLARGLMGILQTIEMFTFGVLFMGLHLSGSIFGITVIALTTIFAATTLGMLIATMGKTLEQIQGMITLVMVVMGLISGCLMPREFLPETLQKFSYVTPHAWALTAYQDILLRDRSLLSTLPNLMMVMLFGTGFLVLALRRFRYE